MRYTTIDKGVGSFQLKLDAERVSNGVAANQSQESLDDQLKDLHVLATRFGLYDAADWLKGEAHHRDRFHQDYGNPLSHEDIDFNAGRVSR